VKSPTTVTQQDFLIFDKTFVLLSGITLLEADLTTRCEILYVATPHKLIPNIMGDVIEELWETKLPVCDKKFIVNMSIGWADKKYNKTSRCEYFDDEREAWANKIDKPNASVMPIITHDSKLYLVVDRRQTLMNEGFLPISFFKYDTQRLAMWKMYKTLHKGCLRIVGINTDCLYVQRDAKHYMREHIDRFNSSGSFKSIGMWTMDHNEKCPRNVLEVKHNEDTVKHIDIERNVHSFDEEADWANPRSNFIKLCCATIKKRNTLIHAPLPGSGKSYLAKKYVEKKKHVVVVPYNVLCEYLANEGWRAITVYRLLGLGVDEGSRGQHFNMNNIQVVILDEIYLFSRSILRKLFRFTQHHPTVRFIGTGDLYQNPAVENVENVCTSKTAWRKIDIINFLFPSQITLNIVKRVKHDSDREAYAKIWNDLFVAKLSVAEVVNRHKTYFAGTFDELSDLSTKMNICHSNTTRDTVNAQVHGGKPTGIRGTRYVLKGYVKGMVRNATYTVVSKGIVKNHSGKRFNVKHNQFKLFELPYCWTSYALQGMTIDEEFSIFDINQSPMLSRSRHARSFWTAVTRAGTLKNVHVFTGTMTNPDTSQLDEIIQHKLDGHKAYDIERAFYDTDHFVTLEWVKKQLRSLGMRCEVCGVQMRWHGSSQFSVDRLVNAQGHSTMNCRVICLSCNKAKH
jgi:hypothetical protein